MSGVPYHAWTHAPKEKGGTDPIVNEDTSAALLTDWSFSPGEDEFAGSTWERLGSGGDGARFFDEAWAMPDWTVDFDGGSIARSEEGLYVCYGSVTFPNAVLDGATNIGVGIRFSSSATHFHANTILAASEERLDVTATWWGSLTVDIWAWHDAPGPTNVGLADLVARRFERMEAGEITARP